MSLSQPMSALQVEDFLFPPAVKPPSSTNDFFLAGAGVRGVEIPGKFLKVTAIGVYLEAKAVSSLAVKWKGKNAVELNDSVEFFRDIVTGPFEKFTRVTMILPLTGQQYAEKVSENCVAIWKSFGIFTEAEVEAIERFAEAFKHENFSPGSSILFTQLPQGSLAISFAKHDSVPAVANVVIENKLLSEAVLESIIGKNGVSPAARQSLATRLSEALKESGKSPISTSSAVTKLTVESFSFPASVKPPASNNTLFLSGAGVRGMEINGKFIKFTAIGVYLEDKAVTTLVDKWKGKSAAELDDSVEFFRDIVTGPFEKFTRVTMILPLTGQQYSEKVAENCVAIWKKLDICTDAEAKAIDKFLEVFKDKTFAPGSSILFTHLLGGSVAFQISFSKDESVPEDPSCVIDNKLLSESVLESIIGKNGVSPEARTRMASRLSALLNQC